MSLDVLTLLKGIKQYINENNTTTSSNDISSTLHSRVATLWHGANGMSDNLPLGTNELPSVIVELANDNEEISTLGKNALRDVIIKVNVVALTDYGMGLVDARQKAVEENITLTQKIKDLLRLNHGRMSDVCDYSVIESTDYGIKYSNDTWNVASKIGLSVRKRST